MLPLAYVAGGLLKSNACIKDVRFGGTPPVARVAVVEATLAPSTNKSNAVPLRLHATECQFPSNAVPPRILFAITVLFPRALAEARDVAFTLSPPMKV